MIAALYGAVPRMEELALDEPVDWQINEGQHWAVIGQNGAGKSLLCNLLLGRVLLKSGKRELKYGDKISEWAKMIAFNDLYSLPDVRNSYYQQRWNATEIETVPTVRTLLGELADKQELLRMSENFHLSPMLDKPVLALSCGEMRKFLIVKAMQSAPKLLILDNPFVGLDAASRKELSDIFSVVAGQGKMHLILLVSEPSDIPSVVTNVLPVKNKHILPSCTRMEFLQNQRFIDDLFDISSLKQKQYRTSVPVETLEEELFRLDKVSVCYGRHTLLNRISWQVNKGEHWALVGPNGAGKSTLLSLLCGDNPQAYAQQVFLFGKKRGSGESIWDIKKRIGYLSPEMQLYFSTPLPAVDVVASGFFDTMGLFRKPKEEQRHAALLLMDYFGIQELSERLFTKLSSGEQRLVLLCRALVKEPEILILDEPLQGLDKRMKEMARNIIGNFIEQGKRTMLYVSHNLEELPPSVHRIYSLPGGNISMR